MLCCAVLTRQIREKRAFKLLTYEQRVQFAFEGKDMGDEVHRHPA